jgi:hypothetical protein
MGGQQPLLLILNHPAPAGAAQRAVNVVSTTLRVAGVGQHLRYRNLLGTADRLPSEHRHRIIAASGWMPLAMTKMIQPPTGEEIDNLLTVLRHLLEDATNGPYAEKHWARSVEVEIFIIEEWRKEHQAASVNASDRYEENNLPAVSRASHYS